MSLHPEDGRVVRSVGERVEKANARERAVRLALVTLAVVCVIAAAGFGGWNTYRISEVAEQNKVGVDRIVDCTTAGFPCYEEQQASTNRLVSEFLVKLNQGHIELRCLLDAIPGERDADTKARCREIARVETEQALEEAKRRIEEERLRQINQGRNTTSTTTGG